MRAKDRLGRDGEDLAVRHLAAAGLDVLERNWRCREGEIDVVAREGDVLVVVEVKTRTSNRYGTPLESVTPRKLARLRRLAVQWMYDHGCAWARLIRVDVIGIVHAPGTTPVIQHLRDVVP